MTRAVLQVGGILANYYEIYRYILVTRLIVILWL